MAKRDNHWRRTCIVRLWVRILLLIKVKKLAAKSHQRDENFIQWYCPKIDGPQRVSRGDDGGGLPFSDWADPIKVVWESPICRWIRTSVTRFGKKLQVFGKFLSVYFIFDKMLSLLWQICDILGLIFNFANGQILKNNLTIWSRCLCDKSWITCNWGSLIGLKSWRRRLCERDGASSQLLSCCRIELWHQHLGNND